MGMTKEIAVMRSCALRPLFPVILLLLLFLLSPCGRDSPTRPSVPSRITIAPSASILSSLGATVRLIASVQDQDGNTLTGAEVQWLSSNVSVASVSVSGMVTAVGMGAATITATSGGVQGQAAVTVSIPVPTHISVSPAMVSLTALGQTAQLSAVVRDQRDLLLPEAEVQWSSSNGSVASVSVSGMVTAVGMGAATITATSGGVQGQAAVTVSIPVPTHISVSPAMVSLTALGQTAQLSAVVRDQRDLLLPEAEVQWSSSNGSVASVSVSGMVTARENGAATVTAVSGGASASSEVTVTIPDRSELAALHHAANGPNWTQDAGWLSNAPLSEWYGVTTDGDGRVIGLGLGDNNLSGAIPSALGGLGSLTHLDLSTNDLSGAIPPELGDLDGLTHLDLSHNPLSGVIPPSLIRLGLQSLRISGTELCVPRTIEYESWLEGIADRDDAPYCDNPDRDVLIALYHATDGPNWAHNSGWLSDAPLGEWHGVTTDRQGRVTGLTTSKGNWCNKLKNSLPAELGNLSELRTLNLHCNQLSGPIPAELGNLSSLQNLDLTNNRLTGSIPSELGNLSNLRVLRLGGNDLSGSIPPELGNLSSLTEMYITGRLSGSIPPELGNLTNLSVLKLRSSGLSGSIPPELGNLVNLRDLNLYNNALSGSIPPELGNLASLSDLVLNQNQLTGPIPPELGNLSNLIDLELGENQLSGPIPRELRNLTRLDGLNLSSNALSGGIPSWLGDLANLLGVFIEGNQLSGPIPPELGNLFNLIYLQLDDNDLSGGLPPELGNLTNLWSLTVSGNRLSGAVPLSLAALGRLHELGLNDTGLCVLPDAGFEAWLEGIEDLRVPGPCADPDRVALAAIYNALGGPGWTHDAGWLSDQPLSAWHGVSTDGEGRVIRLSLAGNNLRGAIPIELGALSSLEELSLRDNHLTGPLPSALSSLTLLEHLDLGGNALSGPLPLSLSRLDRLRVLHLDGTDLCALGDPDFAAWLEGIEDRRVSGCEPGDDRDVLIALHHALGGPGWRVDLNWLSDAPIYSWHGIRRARIDRVFEIFLPDNRLSGALPAVIGNLDGLESLDLSGNKLSGPIPSELGGLSNLRRLILHNNAGLSGPLPLALTALDLDVLRLDGTDLCAPRDAAFVTWLQNIPDRRVAPCADAMAARAYLAQAVQSLDYPVPLVAGERSFLRVFVTTDRQDGVSLPPVRATFFHGGAAVHTVDIPARDVAVPMEIDEGSLSSSANADIPSRVVAPGLEMVIEIAPYGASDFSDGVGARLPETGRTAVEVKEVPPLDLTLVPFLWTEYPDRTILSRTEGLTADDDLFWQTRDLLPVGDFAVTARDYVWTSVDPVFENISTIAGETSAIRALDGGQGHYMGILRDSGGGQATLSGRVSVSILEGGLMAHELGHNMSLEHAPCGGPGDLDPLYPYREGRIGSWGYNLWGHDAYLLTYDVFNDLMVSTANYDLMSYCSAHWISDYHFGKALRYRHSEEAASPPMAAASLSLSASLSMAGSASAGSAPSRSLLLWGGVDAAGALELMPSFAVDAEPYLPAAGGRYLLTGEGSDGRTLFTLRFEMEMFAGGAGGAFAFVLPAAPSWAGRLAQITLSGPEGRVSIDSDGERPAALLIDRLTGRVRGILREAPVTTMTPAARLVPPEPGLEIVISTGIPEREAW